MNTIPGSGPTFELTFIIVSTNQYNRYRTNSNDSAHDSDLRSLSTTLQDYSNAGALNPQLRENINATIALGQVYAQKKNQKRSEIPTPEEHELYRNTKPGFRDLSLQDPVLPRRPLPPTVTKLERDPMLPYRSHNPAGRKHSASYDYSASAGCVDPLNPLGLDSTLADFDSPLGSSLQSLPPLPPPSMGTLPSPLTPKARSDLQARKETGRWLQQQKSRQKISSGKLLDWAKVIRRNLSSDLQLLHLQPAYLLLIWQLRYSTPA